MHGTPDFRPVWWARSPHVQTALGALLGEPAIECETKLHRIDLDDQESLACHENAPPGNDPKAPIALLVHGLGGCHQSGYLIRIARYLLTKGVRVLRVDLRGSAAGMRWAWKPAHAGRSDDIAATLRWANQVWPDAALGLAGFSMGGNIVLKLVGRDVLEQPQDQNLAWRRNLRVVVAVAPPVDLAAACRSMQRGTAKLYSQYFLRLLRRQLIQRQEIWPQWRAYSWEPAPRSIWQFDDRFTAPLSGFDSAEDYYRRSSAGPGLKAIDVPTAILAACDDPVVPYATVRDTDLSDSIQLVTVKRGGHVGFLSYQRRIGWVRWMDQWVHEQLFRALR